MAAERPPVTIRIRRETIVRDDTSGVTSLLGSFLSGGRGRKRNRIRMEVSGYEEDPRELFEIEEVRDYFQKLFEENEGLFYWIDVHSDTFMLLGLMLFEPLRDGETAGLSPEDLQEYLRMGLSGLESFCREQNLSAGETEREVARLVKSRLGS